MLRQDINEAFKRIDGVGGASSLLTIWNQWLRTDRQDKELLHIAVHHLSGELIAAKSRVAVKVDGTNSWKERSFQWRGTSHRGYVTLPGSEGSQEGGTPSPPAHGLPTGHLAGQHGNQDTG